MSSLKNGNGPTMYKKRTRSTSESPKKNGSLHHGKCETIEVVSIKDQDDDDEEDNEGIPEFNFIKLKRVSVNSNNHTNLVSPSPTQQQPRKRRKISTESAPELPIKRSMPESPRRISAPETPKRRSLRSSSIEYIETITQDPTPNNNENENMNGSIKNITNLNTITDMDIDSDSKSSYSSSSSTVSTITSDDNNIIKETNHEQNGEINIIKEASSSSQPSSSFKIDGEQQKHHETLNITNNEMLPTTSSSLSTALPIFGYCESLLNVPDPPIIMPTKTNYLPAGLLSYYYKGAKKESQTNNFTNKLLPQPIYCEELLLRKLKDFTLPYDTWCFGVIHTKLNHEKIQQQKKEERDALKKAQRRKKKMEKRPVKPPLNNNNKVPMPDVKPDSWNYRRIRTNVYSGQTKSKTYDMENEQPCSCMNSKNKCSTDDCINRCLKMECPAQCGENCRNRRIQKYETCKNLKKFMTTNKGWGVKAIQPIKKGEFLLEYVGEVVPDAVFKERMITIYTQDTHHYCLHLDGGFVIDGHRMGGECRFVNHSCFPNCEMQKWSVNGLSRMALFSLRDIEQDEELSYDYNFSLFNPAEGQPCHCGSENCRGVIGNRSKNDKRVMPKRKAALGNTVLVSPCTSDPAIFDKMKPLYETNKKYIQEHNIFLVKNFEKIRLRKGPQESTVNEKLEKLMVAWLARFKVGSNKNKPPIVNDSEPELKKMAKVASILYDLFANLTTVKDGNNLLCEPFMKLPCEKKYPQLYSNFSKQQKQPLDLTLIGKKILRGQYMSIDHLEIDFLLVLREFSAILSEEKPGIDTIVKNFIEAYRNAKTRTIPALEPFIIGENIPNLVPEEKDDRIQCICGIYTSEGCMVQCEKCLIWQHSDCVDFNDTNHNFQNNPKWKNNSIHRSYQSSPTSSQSSSTTVSPVKENRKNSPRKMTLFNGSSTIPAIQSIEEEKEMEQDMDKKEFYTSMKENECPKYTTDSDGLSDMETQPLVDGYTDTLSEEEAEDEEARKNELSLIPKAENNEKTEVVVLQNDQSNSNETPYYCENCLPRPFDEEILLKDHKQGPKGEIYYLTLKREDGFIIRKNCTYYILRDTPIENHENMNDNNNLHTNNNNNSRVEGKESTNIILRNTSTTTSTSIVTSTTINGSVNEQQKVPTSSPLSSSPGSNNNNNNKISVSYKTAGPLVPENCDIFHAESLWKNIDGSRVVYGHLYLRPCESFHEASRKFYPNEILYSPTTEIIPIDKIHGQCWVMDGASFCTGRPKGFDSEEHIYICENRTDTKGNILPKKQSKKSKKNNSSICTEPYAFQKFETKLVIQRNYYPHGVPIVTGPKNSKKNNKKSSDGDVDIEKSKKQMIDQKTKKLNRLLLQLHLKVPNFNDEPADFSGLLVAGGRRKKSKVFSTA